jgi:hypothetical protein
MIRLITTLLLCVSIHAMSQNATLEVEFELMDIDTSINYANFRVELFNNKDSLIKTSTNFFSKITFATLDSGSYYVQLKNSDTPNRPYLTKAVSLKPNEVTSILIEISISETHFAIDTNSTAGLQDTLLQYGIKKNKSESQLSASYFQTDWLEQNSYIKDHFSVGFSTYKWLAFSKHFGFLAGQGTEFSQYYFSKDTTIINAPQYNKKKERYNYIAWTNELKFRISSSNQQAIKNKETGFLMDIGASYNLPIIFREVGKYEDNVKITNKRIHQFSDVRLFVNIDHYPLLAFFEYRPFDFIKGNRIELPKYNAGLKLVFGMD